jgi:SAM-dependent methyltransferase
MFRDRSKAESIDNGNVTVAEDRLGPRPSGVLDLMRSAWHSRLARHAVRIMRAQTARLGHAAVKITVPRHDVPQSSSESRVEPLRPDDGSPQLPSPEGLIDVKELLATKTVEELAERADAYFRPVLSHPEPLLAKPVASVSEAPELLISFGTLLRGLQPLPGATVLDFGAGTCWTSRWLAQLGCRVIAMDISPAALELGRILFERNPVIGHCYPPRFEVFDGRRIDLRSETVDYIVCFDAFHHVPNPEAVLDEMGRVLKPGGRAAFSEPGPRHSVLPQSQFEMRNFGVVENDIVMNDVARWAQRAGFEDARVAIFDADTYWCSPTEFESLSNPINPQLAYVRHLRSSLANRRLFILKKQGFVPSDSRDRTRLGCQLELTEFGVDTDAEGTVIISGSCRAVNTGTARWLPSDADIAPVRLGVRARREGGAAEDLARFPLPGSDGLGAGESCEIPFRIELPVGMRSAGQTRVEIDLVSEGIAWFAINGSQPLEIWPGGPESKSLG